MTSNSRPISAIFGVSVILLSELSEPRVSYLPGFHSPDSLPFLFHISEPDVPVPPAHSSQFIILASSGISLNQAWISGWRAP